MDQLLVERTAVPQADVDRAREIQKSVGGRLGPLLVRTGALSEDSLLRTLAEQTGRTYLHAGDALPDSLEVYRFGSESPTKLDWFSITRCSCWEWDSTLCCLARDVFDRASRESLGYFHPDADGDRPSAVFCFLAGKGYTRKNLQTRLFSVSCRVERSLTLRLHDRPSPPCITIDEGCMSRVRIE